MEKQEHLRIEDLEEVAVRLFEGQSLQRVDNEILGDVKKIVTNFDVSLYNRNGVILSTFPSSDPLREIIPFDPALIDELVMSINAKKEERPHLHKHFNYQGSVHMASFYLFEGIQGRPPLVLSLVSVMPSFYEFRNRISLIVTITTVLILGIFTLFLILIIRKYVVKPTLKFTELVEAVGKGDLKARPPIPAYGEMTNLSEDFSIMIDRLREAREKEQAVNRLKTEILSIAAHNLRTPLTAAKWSLRMILDKELGEIATPEQKKMLGNIYTSNENMISLINDLLDVGRIEEGQFNYSWSYNNIGEVVNTVMESSGSKTGRSGLKVVYHRPEKPLPKIRMDLQKMVSVVGNLLDNALKYTPEGKVEVSIFYKEDPPRVVFEIKDTGIGIPKIEQKKLFSKFFRASNVLGLDIRGTGLGLFIAKEIVKKHKGKVWFKPRKEGGSIFGFSLPVEKKFAPKEEYIEFLENI